MSSSHSGQLISLMLTTRFFSMFWQVFGPIILTRLRMGLGKKYVLLSPMKSMGSYFLFFRDSFLVLPSDVPTFFLGRVVPD